VRSDQDCASIVYLLEPWWRAAEVERQALSRVHRLGQLRTVYVKRLVAHGTVEDDIIEIQERKLRISTTRCSSGPGSGSKLTEDDLRNFSRVDARFWGGTRY